MSSQAKNEFYKDEEGLIMDDAAAVNAEIRDLKTIGADLILLDETRYGYLSQEEEVTP